MSGLPSEPNAHVSTRKGTRPTLSPLFFDPGSHGCYELFEVSLVYLAQESKIKVALKELLEDLEQRLFPDATAPC